MPAPLAGPRWPSIGQLRHKIELQTKAVTPGTGGKFVDAYTTAASGVDAEIVPLQGGRWVAGAQAEDERATHRITIRYRGDWRDLRHIVFGGRRFRIRSARDLEERRRFVEFMAEETEAAT